MLIKTIKRKPSYNSELTPLPIVTSFAHAKAPPTCRWGVKHGNDVSSSFVIRKFPDCDWNSQEKCSL